MSELSNLTGKFRVRKDAHAVEKPFKRPRETLVCSQCRKTKLRCDRQRPCGSCVKKNEAEMCSYQHASSGTTQPNNAEDRLAHLESLVRDLIQGTTAKSTVDESVSEIEKNISDYSDLRIPVETANDELGTRYAGSTHWSAILDDIHDIKAALSQCDYSPRSEQLESMNSSFRRDMIIFGSAGNYPTEMIISKYLPSKLEVDRLLAVYFQGEAFIIPFIHAPQFQRHYRAFWENPAASNPLWLSILFSICSTASMVQGTVGLAPTTREDVLANVSHFQEAAGKCLVRGEYHRPQKYVLEALTLYAQTINMQSLDPSREVGAIFGMIVRMAYEMGYHRDPDSLGSTTISVFEGEMRRRFWALCKQVDLMVSFQLGLPSNICLENCDTKSPRNLADSDFDEDTLVLPPSRSENEPIGILWFIVKDRQMNSFSKVCRDTLSFDEKSETEISQLDSEIRRMYTTIPESLRTRSLADSISDPPFLVMTRIYVEFIYLKSLCVFHRKYMVRGDLFSTKSCVDAGQRLVSHFIEIYRELSSGGQLHRERWMLTNFTMNDFLLGCMVLCLAISILKKNPHHLPDDLNTTEQQILSLLRQAHTICIETSSASRDARYVAQVIMATLNKQNHESAESTPLLPQYNSFGDNDPSLYLGWLDPFQAGDESGLLYDWGLSDTR